MSNVVDVNPGVDDARWQPHTAKSAPAGTILRLNPSVASTAVTVLLGDVAVQHIPFEALTAGEQARAKQGGYTWQVLKVDNTQAVGWARGDVITLTPKPVEPPAPDPEPEEPTPEPPPVGDYVSRAEFNALLHKHMELQAALIALESRLVALVTREVQVNEQGLLTAMARGMVRLIDERAAAAQPSPALAGDAI